MHQYLPNAPAPQPVRSALASKYGLAVAGSGGASAEATVGALGTTTAAAASEGAPAEGPALPAFPGSAQVVRLA